MMSGQPPAECCVSGALGCALRMSRVAGVAPLRLRRLRTGWRARLSPAATVYGNILVVALCVLTLVAFLMDGYTTPDTSSRIPPRVIVFYVKLVSMTLVVFTSAFSGTTRMKNMIIYLNQIHKINLELSRYGCTPSNDKNCWLLLILSMIGGITTVAMEYGILTYILVIQQGKVLMWILVAFNFLMYVMMLMIQIQFALLAIAALSPLKQLNGCLNDLLKKINSQNVSRSSKKVQRNLPEAVCHLARLYSCACDVVRLVDKSHGPILVALMMSYLLHLVIALYFIIKFFLTDTSSTFYGIGAQSSWVVFLISSLIIVVEPCQHTQEEMENTREIVSQMAPEDPLPEDPLSFELELFYRYLILNQVTYSPLKMLTMNRALVVTMLSAIATYLIVVVQF